MKTLRRLIVIVLLVWIAFMIAVYVAKASNDHMPLICGPHRAVSADLWLKHSEAPVSMGVTAGGGVIEVYASPKGTWTLVITQPNGMSCLIAVGQDWEELPNRERKPHDRQINY